MKIGFFSLLAIVFIILKLVGTITWSWFWVLCPLWGGFLLYFIMFSVVAVFAVIVHKDTKPDRYFR